jgi:hypothetical protein
VPFQKKKPQALEGVMTVCGHEEMEILPLSSTIESAVLHQACMFAGGRTESTMNAAKIPGLTMHWITGEGLFFDIKNKNITQHGFIPAAAVKIVYYK